MNFPVVVLAAVALAYFDVNGVDWLFSSNRVDGFETRGHCFWRAIARIVADCNRHGEVARSKRAAAPQEVAATHQGNLNAGSLGKQLLQMPRDADPGESGAEQPYSRD
jgi:hypothetical protein